MAEIPVEPKRPAGSDAKRGAAAAPRWLWLLVALSAVIFLLTLTRGCADSGGGRAAGDGGSKVHPHAAQAEGG